MEIIDRVQPCDGGNPKARQHVLWFLSRLSNLDKHRRIHVALLAINQVSSDDVEASVVTHLEPETGTVTLGIAPLPEKETIELKVTLDVAFWEGEDIAGLPVFDTLVGVIRFLPGVLNQLKPYAT
jgi:hypothetical protein